MTITSAKNALRQKQKIIEITDNDHWLHEPIEVVLEELEVYKRAFEIACKEVYMLTAISTSVFEKEILNTAMEQIRREGVADNACRETN